jgi:hypothetical protein
MHRFRIDDIAESARGIPDTTLCYFDVDLPDRALPGHAIVDVTDVTDRDSLREYIATALNTMVSEDGSDRVVEALASPEGLRISSP